MERNITWGTRYEANLNRLTREHFLVRRCAMAYGGIQEALDGKLE
jgi:hypothetical protein